MRLLLLFVLFVSLFQVSCKKYVAADPAFFIQPALVSVSTTTAQGSNSSRISDLGVYVDGKFKGYYPVENAFPVVNYNQHVSLDILPGIKNNGIKDTRIFYPFYEILHFDTLVSANSTISRPFTFKYKAATNFTWTENFENAGFSVIKSQISDTLFTLVTGSESYEGRCLRLNGSNTATLVQVESAEPFGLPLNTANVYLELNYKCNTDVTIGLISTDGIHKEAFHLNASANWNKIYISMANTVNTLPVTSKQKVYFRMYKLDGEPMPELFIDNIKLVFL
ncbi:MAG: hypothetical protein IT236_12470 [Bacteroidia bacterium]|nr:hypothetical protein [Bacteroidia bacterium]